MLLRNDDRRPHFVLRRDVGVGAKVAQAANRVLQSLEGRQNGRVIQGGIPLQRWKLGANQQPVAIQVNDPRQPSLRCDLVELAPQSFGEEGDRGVPEAQRLVHAKRENLLGGRAKPRALRVAIIAGQSSLGQLDVPVAKTVPKELAEFADRG